MSMNISTDKQIIYSDNGTLYSKAKEQSATIPNNRAESQKTMLSERSHTPRNLYDCIWNHSYKIFTQVKSSYLSELHERGKQLRNFWPGPWFHPESPNHWYLLLLSSYDIFPGIALI